MNPIPFILKLKAQLVEEDWGWVIAALRQDALVWGKLESDEVLSGRALSAFGSEPGNWSPAGLALLEIGSTLSPENLRADPLRPLPQPTCAQAVSAYKAWQREASGGFGLAEAGLVALSLRERRRVTGSWKGLVDELKGRRATSAILACLYGYAPDAQDFLLALLGQDALASQAGLALHSLLSNPLPPPAQCDLLQRLAGSLPPAVGLAILRLLGEQRPALAPCLAEELVARHGVSLYSAGRASAANGGALLVELGERLTEAEVRRLAADRENESPALDEAIKAACLLQAEIAGSLAKSAAARSDHDAAVELWKQAFRLAPESPRPLPGLALALVGAGRVAEASLLLEESRPHSVSFHLDGQAGSGGAAHPSVLAASAVVAARMGERERARQMARQALEWAESQPQDGRLSEMEPEQTLPLLSKIFLETGHPQEAGRCSGLALHSRPNDPGLLKLHAQALHAQGQPEAALGPAAAALALGEEKRRARLLLIDCLESAGEWAAALHERLSLSENIDRLEANELHALASCALHAGQFEQAASACQQALEQDAEDGLAYNLLGETILAKGDPQAATQHFQQATRYAPHLPSAWLSLVASLRQAGQEEQANEALRTASQAIPDSAEIQLALAETYLAGRALTQALGCLRRAYALAPGHAAWSPTRDHAAASLSPLIALRLGQTLHALGCLDEARQVLEEAYQALPAELQADRPESGLAYAYAQALLGLGEMSQALNPLERAVRLQPDEPAPNLDYARTLLETGDRERQAGLAIPVLERVMAATAESSEEYQEAQALLAEALTASGDLGRASEAFRKALEMPLAQAPAWRSRLSLGMGQAALDQEQIETAMAALQEAVQADPSNLPAQRKLCEASLAAGLHEEALLAARAALRLNPYDPETVAWFAEQAVRLRDQTGEMQSQARSEAISALERATQLTPSRTDLILHLGEMQMQAGDTAAALETFGRLTGSAGVDLQGLYQGAKHLRELGDPQQSVLLLERALALLEKHEGDGTVDLPTLLRELIAAHRQAGNTEAVAEVLDRTLAIQPDDTFLYVSKADLLVDLERPDEALECLEKALALEPEDAERNKRAALHERAAYLLRITGDLPSALAHAEESTRLAEDAEGTVNLPARCLAAYLARAMLQPVRARRFLELHRADASDDGLADRFNFACMRAEMALDADDEEGTSAALSSAAEMISGHPRLAAIQARHTARSGDVVAGAQALRPALANLDTPQPDSTHPLAHLSLLRGLAEAAVELGEWDAGVDLAKQVAAVNSLEPLAHFQLAQALVLRAEAQHRCQALEIVTHAPGAEALSIEAYTEFSAAVLAARELAFRCAPEPEEDPGSSPSPAAGLQADIAVWEARGQAAFKTSVESVQALEKVLQLGLPGPEDVAAYIASLGRLGQTRGAVKAVQAFPHNPQVLMEAAIALAGEDPRQALGIASSASADAANPAYRINGRHPGLHALLARLTSTTGGRNTDQAAALNAIQTALAEWPDEPRWHALAARICLRGSQAGQRTEPLMAVHHLETAAQLEPEFSPHHLALGKQYLEMGEQAKALKSLELATRLAPEMAAAWLALAGVQQAAGEVEQAAFSAERAIESAPEEIEPLLLRGEIAMQAGNPRAAQNRAEAILQAHPDQPGALHLLARALEALNHPGEALAILEKAIPLAEDPLPLQLERARLVRSANGPQAGLEVLRTLSQQIPDDANILANLAGSLLENGQAEPALQAARHALHVDCGQLSVASRAGLHFQIGRQLRNSGQLDQAIHHLSEAISQAPENVETYLELGRAFLDRRQLTQALGAFQQAMKIARNDFRPYYQAGLALKESKDYLGAEEMLRRAAELAPNDVSIHRMLGAVVALNLVHNRRHVASQP